jgi:phospholipid N-methyltransferase
VSTLNFFSEFLKPKNKIGAVVPSSIFLVKKMIKPIKFTNVKCIVEFGAGTGTITKELLNRMPKDAVLLAFEINEDFCEELQKINDQRIKIISDTAENLEKHLLNNNIITIDYIVSSLPFAMIPNETVQYILTSVKKVLGKKGTFIQYQYSLNAFKRLKKTFKHVKLSFTFLNIPPAFIFTCTN